MVTLPCSSIEAVVRTVSRTISDCALTYLERQNIQPEIAHQQHQTYIQALQAAGASVTVLPELAHLPDAVFIEDIAVLLDSSVILCRPGNLHRQPEVESTLSFLSSLGPTFRILTPGTLEGGDVLTIGKTMFVGRSTRTNSEGIQQLKAFVEPLGWRVRVVEVHGCLHLKTGVTAISETQILANPRWIHLAPFREFEILYPVESEPWAANTLRVGETVFTLASCPRTSEALAKRGCHVHPIDISELQKAEAGLTCLSLIRSIPIVPFATMGPGSKH